MGLCYASIISCHKITEWVWPRHLELQPETEQTRPWWGSQKRVANRKQLFWGPSRPCQLSSLYSPENNGKLSSSILPGSKLHSLYGWSSNICQWAVQPPSRHYHLHVLISTRNLNVWVKLAFGRQGKSKIEVSITMLWSLALLCATDLQVWSAQAQGLLLFHFTEQSKLIVLIHEAKETLAFLMSNPVT